MGFTGYLLDTNIAIAILEDDPGATEFVAQARRDQVPCYFSVITESEVFTGINDSVLRDAKAMFAPSKCIDVNSAIARKAAEVRREQKARIGRKLKTPDALIIATALKHEFALVSRDSDMNFVHAEYGMPHIVI